MAVLDRKSRRKRKRAESLSPDTWQQIRQASEAGIPDAVICNKYNISDVQLRVRRLRGNWLTQNDIKKEIRELHKQKPVTLVTKPCNGPSAAELLAENIVENGHTGSILGQKLALRLVQDAAENPDFEPVTDVTALSAAVKLIRNVAGMDKAAPAVQMVVWGGQGAAKSNEEWCDE